MANSFPTVYEYYTSGGIKTGLSEAQPYFTLNNKKIQIFSGALHYFRVPKPYWRDRLRKYRAAGLNCVETYVPWNLHEPQDGVFDFGNGGSDFEEFLDIAKFIKMAQEEDLLVILRPGPYICAEWDFGGLPSWLLRYKDIQLRTSDQQYLNLVERYFKSLLEIVVPLQFTKGGPIIALQIENEYGNVKEFFKSIDTAYLVSLKNILKKNGIEELLFTSDTPSNGFSGTLPDVLATANFQDRADLELGLLKLHQPSKPLMVMEYWTGWFDHWTEKHHTRSAEDFAKVLEDILKFNSSFNLYMMHGGTNWGFLNGANLKGTANDNEGYQPDITSYDYDAPLSEAGDYTDKFHELMRIISNYSDVNLTRPPLPEPTKKVAYPDITVTAELTIEDLIEQSTDVIESETLLPMELLPRINKNSGQSYGYIVYRKTNVNIPANAVLKIEGRVCDTVLVLVNGKLVSKVLSTQSDLDKFGYWRERNSKLELGNKEFKAATLDLVVENWGRVNYGQLHQFRQFKGLWQGNVLINNTALLNWKIIPLEFKKKWTSSLKNWRNPTDSSSSQIGPKLYKAVLNVTELRDTYIDMRGWTKGFVMVNNFVLARYCMLGPQYTAYLPAPLLKIGDNEILIFEHFKRSTGVTFVEDPVFETHNCRSVTVTS